MAKANQPDMFDGMAAPPSALVLAAQEAWNEYAARFKWHKCNVLDKARRATMTRAIADYGGIAGWKQALEKVSKDRFVQGLVPPAPGSKFKQFKASIDWFCQAKTIRQVGDEFYEDEGADRLVASGKKDGPVETELEKWGRWLRDYKPGRFWPGSQGPRPEDQACRAPAGPLSYWREQNGITLVAIAKPISREERLAGMVETFRKNEMWDDANRVEQELADLQKRPAVLVPAPDVAHLTGSGSQRRPASPQSSPARATDIAEQPPGWVDEPLPDSAYGED